MLQHDGPMIAIDSLAVPVARQSAIQVSRLWAVQIWYCCAERSWPSFCHMLLGIVRRLRSYPSTALQLCSVPSKVLLCKQCLQPSKQPSLQQKTRSCSQLQKLSSLSACCLEGWSWLLCAKGICAEYGRQRVVLQQLVSQLFVRA